ncbi:hypothetical protein K4K55_013073 [Colletotrichum sp. SAR 10_96]|nr:hypothetical protein K4K55_013073 [Colletotrichum sp. SAR 10_96]
MTSAIGMVSIQDAAVPEIVLSRANSSNSNGNGSPNSDDNDMWQSLDQLIGPSDEVYHMEILLKKQIGNVTLIIGGGAAQSDNEHCDATRRRNEGNREFELGGTDIADPLTNATTADSKLDEAEVAETPAKAIVINSLLAALHSPVFRAMLRKNFAESEVNNTRGELLGLDGLPLQLRGPWNTDEIMKSISQLRQRGVDYVHRIFHEDMARASQYSVCTTPSARLCEVSCVKTIIDACNAGGMGSAPMLRVHTGNLADLMGTVQDVGSQIFKARHCGNVDWDVYNVNRKTFIVNKCGY